MDIPHRRNLRLLPHNRPAKWALGRRKAGPGDQRRREKFFGRPHTRALWPLYRHPPRYSRTLQAVWERADVYYARSMSVQCQVSAFPGSNEASGAHQGGFDIPAEILLELCGLGIVGDQELYCDGPEHGQHGGLCAGVVHEPTDRGCR